MTLLAPVWAALRPSLPEVMSLIRGLTQDISPLMGPGVTELATFDLFWLQRSLHRLGSKIAVDGKNGPATEAAVRDFQTRHPPLQADGWAGPQTIAKIIDELSKIQ